MYLVFRGGGLGKIIYINMFVGVIMHHLPSLHSGVLFENASKTALDQAHASMLIDFVVLICAQIHKRMIYMYDHTYMSA